MNGALLQEEAVVIKRTEYDSLINVWYRNKLKESWIMRSYQSADKYCSYLEENRNCEDFANYGKHIDEEIRDYKTTDEEIYSSIQAMIPTVDIS